MKTWQTRSFVVVAALAALLLVPSVGRADNGDQPPLEMQIFDVGALTGGFSMHYGEVPPPVSAGDRWSDHPLFGVTGEEPLYPVGQVDELIEILKGMVDPYMWASTEGADVRALGEARIMVRAPRPAQELVGRFLRTLEQRMLRTARIELRAVRVEGGALPGDEAGRVAALAQVAGRSLTLVGFEGQRVSGTSGRQAAYVGGYRVSVAEGASVSTPMIEVANLGLIADAQVAFGSDPSTARLDVSAVLTEMGELAAHEAGEDREIEVPRFSQVRSQGLFELRTGTWSSLGAGDGWRLVARVTPGTFTGQLRETRPLVLPDAPGEAPVTRMLDVRDLVSLQARGCRAGAAHVMPSLFTPPEPPELPEPRSACEPEALVELLREVSGPDAWNDPASVEIRNGQLLIRQGPSFQESVFRLLDRLRAQLLPTLDLTAEVLVVTPEMAARLQGEGDAAFILGADAQKALVAERAAGGIEAQGRAVLRLTPGVSCATVAGTKRRYVGTYEPMIAQNLRSSLPIVWTLSEGLRVTATARPLSTGDAAVLEIELQQTAQPGPLRSRVTTCGPVELPDLHGLRLRGGMLVPYGQPVLLCGAGEGSRQTVVLLTLERGTAD